MTRVRVQIQNPEEYATGAYVSLNGKLGVLEDINVYPTPQFLVAFDEPAEPWHANSLPHRAFWFEGKDLEVPVEDTHQ
jgi:hypothetical protein